ncbi:MAG: hypothetical protein IPM02_20040 [Betaproteobacteria bacterium]|nr:hypothetical protein [Betaproteobacteria bacterium]
MSLPALLAEFGMPPGLVVERQFATALGVPKAVVRVADSGERWFVGSLAASWPGIEHIDAMFPLLNDTGASLAAVRCGVALGRYRQARTGSFAVQRGAHHHFVRPFFDGSAAAAPGLRSAQAWALALFHEHGWRALHAAGRGGRGTRYAQLFPEWIQPQLAAAFESGLGQAAGPLRATLAAIAQRGAREAHLLDQLPLFLTHADFQGKNILSLPDADAGQPGIAIIDAETAQVQSRLFDFYFLLMGDDGGSLLEDFAAFRALLAAYFEHARGLTGDEARLLGFALQAKAATIAAWTASEYHAAAPGRRQLYKTWFLRALRCIQVVDERAAALRDAAEGFRASPRCAAAAGAPTVTGYTLAGGPAS